MTLAAIDWLRAGADILGAFACAFVGQGWGYRKGRKEALDPRCPSVSPFDQGRCVLPRFHHGTHLGERDQRTGAANHPVQSWVKVPSRVPDRDSERLGL